MRKFKEGTKAWWRERYFGAKSDHESLIASMAPMSEALLRAHRDLAKLRKEPTREKLLRLQALVTKTKSELDLATTRLGFLLRRHQQLEEWANGLFKVLDPERPELVIEGLRELTSSGLFPRLVSARDRTSEK